jgi:DNA-binding NarL/FixJ family response regulator
MSMRLVAVDEHVLLRLGLASVLAASTDIVLVGEAASAAEAMRVVAETDPNVVTIELTLPDGDGITTAGQLRATRPELGLVLLTASNDEALLYRALDAGFSAYVAKSAPAATVLAAVRHAATSPTTFAAPGVQVALGRRPSQGSLLSPRERQVLMLMRDGTSLPTIAARLQVSEATVKTYVSRLYSKLRVNNRAQALMVAVNQGLLPTADVAA